MRGYGNFSVDLAGLPPLKAASTPPCVLGVSCGEGTIKCYMLGGHGGRAGPLSGYLKHLMLLTTGGRTHGAAPGGAGDRPEASAPGATGHPRSPPGAPSGVPSHLLRQPSELLAAEASSSRDPPADPLRSVPKTLVPLGTGSSGGGERGSVPRTRLRGCSQPLGRGCPVEPGATHLQARAAAAHTSSDCKVYLASLSNVCSEPSEPPNSG